MCLLIYFFNDQIVDEANAAFVDAGFKSNAVGSQFFCPVITYDYEQGTPEYTLRDLYSISRIRDIFPTNRFKDINDDTLAIWRSVEYHVKQGILQWNESDKCVLGLIDGSNTACLKKTSDLEDPKFDVGGLCSKGFEVQLDLKRFLLKHTNHDEECVELFKLLIDSNSSDQTAHLVSKLDARFISIFLNMHRTITEVFLEVAFACGYTVDTIQFDEKTATSKLCDKIREIRKTAAMLPDFIISTDCKIRRQLNYSYRYRSHAQGIELSTWKTL